jgi:hypothetical protein
MDRQIAEVITTTALFDTFHYMPPLSGARDGCARTPRSPEIDKNQINLGSQRGFEARFTIGICFY